MMVPERPSPSEHGRIRRVAVCALLALLAAPVQVAAAAAPCGLDLIGTWAPSYETAGSERLLLSFADDGWVTLLAGAPQRPVRNYEMLGAVRYELSEGGSGSIDFTARRAIEMFSKGSSTWHITSHGDESFSVQEDGSSEETQWTRIPADRYFVSFAAGSATGESAGGVPAAFAAWTELDERRTRLQALGAHAEPDGDALRFGRIPETLPSAFGTDPEDDASALLRIQVNEAQFRRSYEVFEAWDVLLRNGLLEDGDPYLQAMEVIAGAVQSVNRCSTEIAVGGRRFEEAVQRPREYASAGGAPAEARLLDFVRHIARVNEAVHVAEDELAAPDQLPE